MYSKAVNAVYDVLVAATATGDPLAYLTHVNFGEAVERVETLEKPFVTVMLDDPSIEEDWVAAKDRRGGAFRILIVMTTDAEDKARPYGVRGASRGVLTMIEDVGDVLDAARATILAADTSRLVDMNLAMRGPRILGAGTWEATVVVSIRPRFTAADRGGA